ncbi:MAG: DUF222 domain-containing protein [Gammaproteobacteria bacterium]|nr:DUF222 domain-containing protein [Gammaproteobacteria bacterium]
MIAYPDVLYDIRGNPPRPAMVRESMGAGSVAEAQSDAIPVPAPGSTGAVARDVGSAPPGSDAQTASPDAIPVPPRPEPVAAPSPSDAGKPDDDLARLGDRIAELAAGINAAEAQMMTLIADFDRRGGWKDGFGSCAEWLAWKIGIKIGPARERVRAARALENLPQTAGALREGSISYAKVRALTRVATPESEAKLLEFARAGSAANLEQMVRMWKKLSRDEELTAEQARHRSRAFSVFVDGDGMYVVKGRLEPEVGAVLMRAVEAASDALFRDEGGANDGRSGAKARDPRVEKADPRPEPKQRRADAVGLLAERALAMGFGGGEPRDSRGDSDALATESRGESGGDPGEPGLQTRPRAESGTRAERYQVMVHCDAATLAAEGEPGRSDLDGIRVSAETSRRMACDAAVVAIVHAKDGSMLSVGRRTRTIPPHIRRALEERDRGCRFPGCGCRFTEAHHVKHWADGGETSLGNTVLLCRRHHRAVHEGRVKVSVATDGTVVFFTRGGKMLADAPRQVWRDLAPVPSVHPAAPPKGDSIALSNGAALYRDSEIPWEIEAAAREAVEESL